MLLAKFLFKLERTDWSVRIVGQAFPPALRAGFCLDYGLRLESLTYGESMKTIRPTDGTLRANRTEQILDAAARLFAKHGFADADTQLLADELGVGKGTIYRYFPSKKESLPGRCGSRHAAG